MSDATTATVPTLTALLKAAVSNHMGNVFSGWMPGRIQAMTSVRKATVELLIQDVEETRLGRTVTPFPILNEVPIVMPGRGGAYIEWTPQRGDTVIVLFCPRATDRYKQTGGLVDPDDVRMHDINDALAIPVGDFDFTHVRSANPQIKFTGSDIQAGGSASLALKSDVASLKSAVHVMMNALAGVGASPVTGSAVAAALATFDGSLTTVPAGTSNLKGG